MKHTRGCVYTLLVCTVGSGWLHSPRRGLREIVPCVMHVARAVRLRGEAGEGVVAPLLVLLLRVRERGGPDLGVPAALPNFGPGCCTAGRSGGAPGTRASGAPLEHGKGQPLHNWHDGPLPDEHLPAQSTSRMASERANRDRVSEQWPRPGAARREAPKGSHVRLLGPPGAPGERGGRSPHFARGTG